MVIANLETFKPPTLPAIYLNRQGDPEPGDIPAVSGIARAAMKSATSGEMNIPMALSEQSEASALNGLRRALRETGQLIVIPHDALSRISFTGIGDPKQLFVESIPGQDPFPILDFDVQGKLCSLSQAEAILKRLYHGETSAAVSELLGNRSPACS